MITQDRQLSVVERGSLRKLEATIEKGVATFIEVGLALRSIRDEKLYREQHKTFEKYVSERWGFDRSRAYQFIDAAEVKQNLSTIVDKNERVAEINKESQLRELVDVPEENLQEVVEKAAEIAGDEPITAKVIKQAKAEIEYEDVPDEPPPTKKLSKAEEAIENAHHIGAVRQLVYGLITAMKAVAVVDGTELYHARLKRLLQLVEPLPAAIRACEPYRVCGNCNGKGCSQCGNHGWVSSSVKE